MRKNRRIKMMDYEIVQLEEKKVAGIKARTNNTSPDMTKVIGGLWQKFYAEGIYESIPGKVTGKSLGIYTEYDRDEKSDYSIIVGCEVDGKETLPENTITVTIPAGRYAKFVVRGELHEAVAACWQEVWNMELPRSFACDFEEYQDSSMGQTEIHIYVSLTD